MERRVHGFLRRRVVLIPLALSSFGACSFDYGAAVSDGEAKKPDVVMTDVEYVRVRGGEPQVRFQADTAERYESTNTMRFRGLRFEQYGPKGGKADAVGAAKSAVIDMASGDADLDGGVRVYVPSEDLSIETRVLQWKNESRTVTGGAEDRVAVRKADGTSIDGTGFSADVRSRTWNFAGGGSGTYVDSPKADSGSAASGADAAGRADNGTGEAVAANAGASSPGGTPVPSPPKLRTELSP